MITQPAFARLFSAHGLNKSAWTHEAATAWGYQKCRTEAMRVITSQLDGFISVMNCPHVSREARKQLSDAAAEVDIVMVKEAGTPWPDEEPRKLLQSDKSIT
ncbi:hypothetical protein DFJ58DRAFT_221614 [Suillus subalutaceus]|uniref:uncharacterized protein n=1 Tax=Suillus subalutaceus TaxID=48586 RepID=UPI001B871908|nr:uncharacterized protein DFJ58DRAFT_221614 [Suillus subalutaceus]KAG1863279.1 hypothetical protein DFJ58DRAFT_221614 [Suillus subalutaceus]